jgi:membrane protease YdiL (CAAX protease family)
LEKIKKILRSKTDRKPFLILLLAPVIFTIWKFQGSPQFFDANLAKFFSSTADLAFLRIAYYGLSSLFFLFLIPAFFIKLVFKEKLSNYGVRFADGKFGAIFILIAFPIVMFSMIPVSHDPQYQALNPMYPDAGKSIPVFILYALIYGLYYIGWEFFFRGFMLFGLREKFGDVFTVLIQVFPSCIAHIGRPEGEMISSILAGLIFGFLALRSRSLWYVLILHWFIGLGCDILCLMAR